MTTAASTTFYKLDIQGIVYLVDPATSTAHTYDLEAPTPIGTVHWTDPAKPPQITLYDDWQTILAAKRDAAAKLIAGSPASTAAA
jgi:hypothetical protein